MKNILSFIKTTLIGGLFFIIPIFLVIFLIEKILRVFRKIVGPIADKIDFTFLGGQITSKFIAVLLLFILCFIAGVFARTNNATRFKDWIENNILSNVPGYSLLKGMTEAAAGLDSKHLKDVVLVDIEEVWQIGFLMERIDDELNAVFIPGAPNPMAGDVVIVKWDRLKRIDIEEINVMKFYRKLGVDSDKIIDGKFDNSTFSKK
ncbi:DUF502 domain-containing protein [Tamlana sp. I1]|uniref:DUF502 domain-containing protein n=1 Tax=Tamlana sp. I1 TaxID=2762061 RepID=UPI00188FA87E|nr:DUF502 domain-containing protein [Tamlana sp. I1]